MVRVDPAILASLAQLGSDFVLENANLVIGHGVNHLHPCFVITILGCDYCFQQLLLLLIKLLLLLFSAGHSDRDNLCAITVNLAPLARVNVHAVTEAKLRSNVHTARRPKRSAFLRLRTPSYALQPEKKLTTNLPN